MLAGIQDVKHELAVLLAGPEFLTALAAIDAEKGVTNPTPPAAAVFEGERFVKTSQGFPVVEVIGARTVYDTASQVQLAIHEVHVVWTQVGDDELTIVGELERLVRATRELLWPLQGALTLPGANSAPIQLISEEYSQLMPAKTHPFVKGAVTVLHVPTMSI